MDLLIFVIIVGFHATVEFRKRLDEYLGNIVGFSSPHWLKYMLFVLAAGNLIIPFWGGAISPETRALFWGYVAGGLVGDILSTHIIPSIYFKKVSPATWTFVLYIPIAIWLWSTVGVSVVPSLLGMASFVILWPTLMVLKKVGILPANR